MKNAIRGFGSISGIWKSASLNQFAVQTLHRALRFSFSIAVFSDCDCVSWYCCSLLVQVKETFSTLVRCFSLSSIEWRRLGVMHFHIFSALWQCVTSVSGKQVEHEMCRIGETNRCRWICNNLCCNKIGLILSFIYTRLGAYWWHMTHRPAKTWMETRGRYIRCLNISDSCRAY